MKASFLRSMPGDGPVVSEALFRAPPRRVFRAWTDPDEVVRWFGREPFSVELAEIDLCVGGSWRFSFYETDGAINVLRGNYLEIEHDALLVFTWIHEQMARGGDLETSAISKVIVHFVPSGNGTLLTVRHENIARHEGRRNVGDGWERALSSLTELLNASEARETT